MFTNILSSIFSITFTSGKTLTTLTALVKIGAIRKVFEMLDEAEASELEKAAKYI